MRLACSGPVMVGTLAFFATWLTVRPSSGAAAASTRSYRTKRLSRTQFSRDVRPCCRATIQATRPAMTALISGTAKLTPGAWRIRSRWRRERPVPLYDPAGDLTVGHVALYEWREVVARWAVGSFHRERGDLAKRTEDRTLAAVIQVLFAVQRLLADLELLSGRAPLSAQVWLCEQ